ncbi:MAG: hypothetical protein PWP46_1834 [Fusobacteriaceae bacterium]|nr:hypothetical protein [Fusobacteriaceae bacterium]
MVKLIATDMDGTLLNNNHEIDKEFWDVLDEIKKKKILFCIASGRQYYNLLERFHDHKDDILFIAENGNYVAYKGEEIFSNSIDKNIIPEFIELVRKIDECYIVLCGKKSAYVENNYEPFLNEVRKYYAKYEIVDDLEKIDDDILKVAIYDFKGSEHNVYPHFKKFEDKYKVVVSAKHWLDIMIPNGNKGVAIQQVQKKYNITKEETMAFGDYLNDLEMLENSGYSYAMENAHPKLKEIAKYIAQSNENNGVVKALKEVLKKL